MALSDLKEPVVQRTVYLNVMYGLMILLSALVVGVLVATEDVSGDKFPRYQVCKFGDNSSTLDKSADGQCRPFVDAVYSVNADPSFVPVAADKDLAAAQQTTYEIAAAAVGMNAVLLTHTLLQHALNDGGSEMLVKLHQSAGFIISLVNIGLFAGILGWLYSVAGVDNEDNFLYNVYFKDVNVIYVAFAGLFGGITDLVFQLYLLVPHCSNSDTDKNAACWR